MVDCRSNLEAGQPETSHIYQGPSTYPVIYSSTHPPTIPSTHIHHLLTAIQPSIHPSTLSLPIYASIHSHPSIHSLIYLSIHSLSIHPPSIHPLIHPSSIYPSTHPFIHKVLPGNLTDSGYKSSLNQRQARPASEDLHTGLST